MSALPADGPARERWIVVGCIVLICALAWAWLWGQSASMRMDAANAMPGMDMGGGAMASPQNAPAYLAGAFLMWLLMMVAMMPPSASPMILIYARLAREARAKGAALPPTSIFAGVYIAVWAVFSAVAALAQWLLVRSGAVTEFDLAFGDRRVGGALLILAGLYQATPLKRACLDGCRSPFNFLMRLWRPGWGGAARLGLVHGMYCLGCCTPLMALLFVFGVMNLAWVAALSVIVLAEKAIPFGRPFGLTIGTVAATVGAAFMLGLRWPA